MRRRYESGMGWCAWRWTDVDWRGVTYLLRLHLLKTPWGALMLHWINGPDPASDPHDHPVDFVSLTVRGGYTEWTPKGIVRKRLRFRRATDVHRIIECDPRTVTLVLCGPVKNEWGYFTRSGWKIDWKMYRDLLA